MGLHIHNNTLSGSEKNKVERYAGPAADEVDNAAAGLYFINNFSNLTTVKFQQWYKAAVKFPRTRGTLDLFFAKERNLFGHDLTDLKAIREPGKSPLRYDLP